MCNHCRRKAFAEENYNKGVRYGFVVVLHLGLLLMREQKRGIHVTSSPSGTRDKRYGHRLCRRRIAVHDPNTLVIPARDISKSLSDAVTRLVT